MTDREKIIEIIAPYISAYGEDEAIADALLAANIGDVTEWKEEVECAKRILQIPALPNGQPTLHTLNTRESVFKILPVSATNTSTEPRWRKGRY